MDGFFSKYGWVVVIGVCITFVVAMLSPVGNLVMGETIGFVSDMRGKVEELIDAPEVVQYEDYILTADNYTWCGITERTGDIVIPETFEFNGKHYKTVGIGDYAFAGYPYDTDNGGFDYESRTECYYITSVQLPDSLESIGDYAFAYTDITEVNLPSGIKHIGDNAFFVNDVLDSVTYKGVEYIKRTEDDLYAALDENGVEHIWSFAFDKPM